ncbi:MAG: aryl-sulfate sulfotransferase [bacterium]
MKLWNICIFVLLLSSFLISAINLCAQEKTMGLITSTNESFEGYTLFAPLQNNTTYLIHLNGEKINTWESNFSPGNSAYLLENGNLLRTANINNPRFTSGGTGGRVQKFSWAGDIIWEFTYSSDTSCQHHDIELIPNGNILMIAWEYKTRAQAIQAGCDPSLVNEKGLYPDHIIEVDTTYEIVWEWHVWDHLVQDYDASKDNYNSVADHPELIDINFQSQLGAHRGGPDWNHTNSIDYNPELDQILLSVRTFNEIWIIDHSATTAEAAGHSGGQSGMGGDLLYRWGNPAAYKAGLPSDQKLFGQHDAQWIESGKPGEGNILIFNNGTGRPGDQYSSIVEIVPPILADNSYDKTPGQAYGPDQMYWNFTADPNTVFFADHISGCQRLANGNTLICDGTHGIITEVTTNMDTVWQYINPVTAGGPLTQGDAVPSGANELFRAYRYDTSYAAFNGKNLYPRGPVEKYVNPLPAADILTHIPSQTGGDRGLFVRITPPAVSRFNDGAPVVISVPGGFQDNGIGDRETQLHEHGFIEIRFNFPGAGQYPFNSGGTYDYRGLQSLQALRDIILFAQGLKTNVGDSTLEQLTVPVAPLNNNIGLVGWSNGGNTNICAAGMYGEHFPGLAWILNWESPVGDGMPQAEAGAKSEENLRPYNSGVNPAYDPATGSWDLSQLAFDSQIQIPILFDTDNHVTGSLYVDKNQNGLVDLGSDFIFYPLTFDLNGNYKSFYSERVRQAAASLQVLPPNPPEHIPTVQETQTFWHWRNGEYWIDSTIQKNPDLMFMIVASDTDHVQISPDHPHVIIQYNGFLNAGCRFVRLNPDKSYVEDYLNQSYPTAADNDAFVELKRNQIQNMVEPGNSKYDYFNQVTVAAAGVCELADRTYYNNTNPQLNNILTGIVHFKESEHKIFSLQNTPNPFNSSTTITFIIEKTSEVTIDAINMRGQQVARIFKGRKKAGTHSVEWEALYQPSGIYFLRLRSDYTINTCKCLLLK